MSTASYIFSATRLPDGKIDVKSIYCHWDGYVDGVGLMLVNHYRDPTKVAELMSLGNLSVLDMWVTPSTSYHTFNRPDKGVCVAYGRDRGEEDQQASSSIEDSVEDLVASMRRMCSKYVYVYLDEEWYMLDGNGDLRKVVDVLNASEINDGWY